MKRLRRTGSADGRPFLEWMPRPMQMRSRGREVWRDLTQARTGVEFCLASGFTRLARPLIGPFNSHENSSVHRRSTGSRELRTHDDKPVPCAQTESAKAAKGCYRTREQKVRQRLESFRFPRPCRLRVERVGVLASQFAISESLSGNLSHGQREAFSVCSWLCDCCSEMPVRLRSVQGETVPQRRTYREGCV